MWETYMVAEMQKYSFARWIVVVVAVLYFKFSNIPAELILGAARTTLAETELSQVTVYDFKTNS